MLSWVDAKEGSPPLYFVLVWGWVKALGSGTVALRSLSVLAGIATVPLVYLAGSTLASRRAGLVAAALTVVSPLMIWYSQEARPYALLVALCAASLWCAGRAANGGSWRWLAAWAATSALALATHFFAGFLIAGEAVWLLAVLRRRALPASLAVVAAQLALLPLALGGAQHSGTQWIGRLPLHLRLAQVPDQFLFGPGEAAVSHRAAAALALAIATAAAVLVVRSGDRRGRRAVRLWSVLAAGCVAGPLVAALVGADYLDARNLMVAWVPLVLVVGVAAAAPRSRLVGGALAWGACGLLAAGSVAIFARSDLQRENWRAVAHALGAPAGSRALLVPAAGRTLLDYLPRLTWDVDRHQRVSEIDVIGARVPSAQGLACWWGGVCALPRQLIPGDLPRGFTQIERRRVGPFIVARYAATRPHRVSLHRATFYRVHHNYAVFFAVQR